MTRLLLVALLVPTAAIAAAGDAPALVLTPAIALVALVVP